MGIIVPDFDQARVLVVGDVMLDRYWHGATHRLSPEAPVPVVHIRDRQSRPGGAGNAALNLATLGAQTIVAGVIGADENGDELRRQLDAAGVDCRLQAIDGLRTTTKIRVISRHQQMIRLDVECGLPAFDVGALLNEVEQILPEVAAMVVSDYGKGTIGKIGPLIGAARMAGVPTIVDPNGPDLAPYKGSTIVVPNLAEFELIAGPCPDRHTLIERGEQIIRRYELDALLITLGEDGMLLVQPTHPARHLPARSLEVYDVTGAGDTVVATIAAALACGESLTNAVYLANVAAGVVVGKLGASTLTKSELSDALANGRQMARNDPSAMPILDDIPE